MSFILAYLVKRGLSENGAWLVGEGIVGLMAIVRNGVDDDPALAEQAQWVTNARHGAGVLEAVERWLSGDPLLDRLR